MSGRVMRPRHPWGLVFFNPLASRLFRRPSSFGKLCGGRDCSSPRRHFNYGYGHTSNFSHRGGYHNGARASNLGFQMEAANFVSEICVRLCVCVRMLYARNC
eukprot:scaffold18488_cov59-Cyclotella_meneghiniana.AAC.16